ncbi:MAG: rod shape-determining protein MreC [Planctomycetes bacterium]|nr:rod shape-determining protein MreC [Planctomycetota bacterium]
MSPNLRKTHNGFSIYLLIVISLLLISLPENISHSIKLTVASPLAPVQKTVSGTGNFFSNGIKKVFSIFGSADEANRLQKKVFSLENEIIRQKNTINLLSKKLVTLSKFHKNWAEDEKPSIANIIGYDTSNLRKSIVIDIGKKHGVSVNDTVVFETALVGRVTFAGTSTSRVMLITDPASNVPAQFLQSRIQGIVKGESNAICSVKFIPRQERVQEGDKVITSGIGGIFPKSLYIGDVVSIKEKGAQLFKEINLKPRIDLSKLEFVLVIKNRLSEVALQE